MAMGALVALVKNARGGHPVEGEFLMPGHRDAVFGQPQTEA